MALKTTAYMTYKGRTYRLLAGPIKSKFDDTQRVKLGYTDGSKEFWVDASLCTPAAAPSPTSKGHGKCENCGERAHCCTRPGCNCGGYDCL